MIYDYYCVDCGEKFKGGEIRFDIAELLGLRQDNNKDTFNSKAMLVDLSRLNEFARHSGIKDGLKHGETYRITVTLKELFELMAENAGNRDLFQTINAGTYKDTDAILEELYTGNAVGGGITTDIRNFKSVIQARFFCEVPEGEEEDDQELDFFEASFKVKPEFFGNGESDELYTLEFNYDLGAAIPRKLGREGWIRGYCPNCGKPIVDGAGKYRHTLVGLLGVQKAGKTSTIVAILEELRRSYRKLGIMSPGNPLWTSRTPDQKRNIELYRKGWAMDKTAVETSEGSFNATLLIEANDNNRFDEQKKQIVTFVDIAGEQCFNVDTNTVDTNAFQVYPLISGCHIFLLCTGIAPDDGDEGMDYEEVIPPEAVVEISRRIYENLREPEEVPPICIVATKSDLAADAVDQEADGNPFRYIIPGGEYQYAEELDNLKTLYDTATEESIREALNVCFDAYEELSRKTYVSLMSCWALGRKAEKAPEGEKIPYYMKDGVKQPFSRMRIDRLCRWIFQVSGILDVDGYHFSCIPSLGEGYETGELQTRGPRKKYPVREACGRIRTVKKVFVNCPDEEENFLMELENAESINRERAREREIEKVIKEHLG